jgi:hypothetical protein
MLWGQGPHLTWWTPSYQTEINKKILKRGQGLAMKVGTVFGGFAYVMGDQT